MGYLKFGIGPKEVEVTVPDDKASAISADIIALFDLDPNEDKTAEELMQDILDLLAATAKGWSQQYRTPPAEQTARDDILTHTDYDF